MKETTVLSFREMEIVQDRLDRMEIGTCRQDSILKKFVNKLSSEAYENYDMYKDNKNCMIAPRLIYRSQKYERNNNHRIIEDRLTKHQIHAYFDLPIDKAELMIRMDSPEVLPFIQFLNAAYRLSRHTGCKFDATPVKPQKYPYTIAYNLKNTMPISKLERVMRQQNISDGNLRYIYDNASGDGLYHLYDNSVIDLGYWQVKENKKDTDIKDQ